MKYIIFVGVVVLNTFQMAHATGLHTCQTKNKADWKSKELLEQKLVDEGWKVRKIKEDGGCYEVYATTPEGERGEAYFHPITFELELLARRGEILFRKSQ